MTPALHELPLFAAASVPAPCKAPAAPLPDPLQQVLAVIGRGAAQARTAEDLLRAAGVHVDAAAGNNSAAVRRLKAQLAFHTEDLPVAIVADTNGYYIADSADEITHYRRNLLSRAEQTLRRLRAFDALTGRPVAPVDRAVDHLRALKS